MGKVIRPFCWHQNFVPWDCLPLPRGYIHVLNQEQNCIKSDFKDIFFKLATNEWSEKPFLLTSKLYPGGYIQCIKSWKQCIKSDFKEIFFKLATNDRSDKMFLLTSKFRPSGVVSPCPGALYRYKIMKTNCIKSDFKESFWTCSKWPKWQEASVDIKILSPAAIYIY